jgi:hypothetical protein
LASGDEELIREIWVHMPAEVRARFVGSWVTTAAELQLDVPFHWLLSLTSDANLDRAVELMVEDHLVGALCEVEATGFDLTGRRPARALASWGRTMSLVAAPAPALPSVPVSTLLAWHVRALRSWDIPCDAPEALASGRVEKADPGPRIDFSSMTKTPAGRVLFIGQAGQYDGIVFGFFANCPLAGAVRGRDPALKSVIFVLEHPTGEQRKWQLRDPDYDITMREGCLWYGDGFCVHPFGFLRSGPAPEFGMTEVEASFVTLKPADSDGWSLAQTDRWELWSV